RGLRDRYAISLDRWLGMLDEEFVLARVREHAFRALVRPGGARRALPDQPPGPGRGAGNAGTPGGPGAAGGPAPGPAGPPRRAAPWGGPGTGGGPRGAGGAAAPGRPP